MTRLHASSRRSSSMSRDHGLERAVGELVERRHRLLVAQQALGVITISGLRNGAQHLPAQQVEHLRRRRRHAHLHVVLGAQLQEALEARRRMLRALPFVAVRQEQHQAADAAPLGFAGADELVDDDLRAVGEVAELRFPDHERVGLGVAIAVLEAEHRLLGQHRVDDHEVAPGPRRCAAAACSCPRPSARGSGRAAPRGGGERAAAESWPESRTP